jgi:chromosome segregation ATPase
MTLLKKFTPAIIVTCLLTTAVFANQSENQVNGYKIQVLDKCQVTKEYDMTNEQINAYLALQVEEGKMESLESPISEIQDELDSYSEQIDELTALAIQETEQSLYIDKEYLKQQEQVVEKLNVLMEAHQQDFDALGSQGNKIGKVADIFLASLEETIGDSKHQQIHIISPDDQDSNYQCHNDIFNI